MTERDFRPVRIDFAAVMKEAPRLRRAIQGRGVPFADVDDVLQEVLFGAYVAIEEGRYRPDPEAHPRAALRGWLRALVRHHSITHRLSAVVRREVPTEMIDGADDTGPDPGDALDAAEALRLLPLMSETDREVLAERGLGGDIYDMAERDGIPSSTLWHRLQRARERYQALIDSEGRRKKRTARER